MSNYVSHPWNLDQDLHLDLESRSRIDASSRYSDILNLDLEI